MSAFALLSVRRMRRGPFDRFQEISRNFKRRQIRIVALDSKGGYCPFRVHYDLTRDGAEVVNMVLDRVRAEMLRRIELSDVLTPRDFSA